VRHSKCAVAVAQLSKAVDLVHGAYPDWLLLLLTPDADVLKSQLSMATWRVRKGVLAPQVIVQHWTEAMQIVRARYSEELASGVVLGDGRQGVCEP